MNNAEIINSKAFCLPENAFLKYSDTVYRLAFVRTKSKSDSDDILQEVFLRYMKIYQKIESEEHLKATLLRITINCSNSLKTSAWFKKTEPLNETLSINDEKDYDTLKAVLDLPLKYRTVIHLYYFIGYSIEEIAKIEKSNSSTIKTRLFRGREMLKQTLKEVEF